MQPSHLRIRSLHPHRRGASLASFLDAHLGHVRSDDVGPIIGQAAFVRESGTGAVALPDTGRAGINAALSGFAPSRSRWARVGRPRAGK